MSLPSYSDSEWISLQKNDPAINVFLNYWQKNQKPHAMERKGMSQKTRALFKQWDKITVQGGLLYRSSHGTQQEEVKQLVLPAVLRKKVLESLHNDMGHQGLECALLLARNRSYWPGMYPDTEKWIKFREHYILSKSAVSKMPQPRIRTTMRSLIATQPLEVLAVDFIVLEPSSDWQENVFSVSHDWFINQIYLCSTYQGPKKQQPQQRLSSRIGFNRMKSQSAFT